MIKKLIKRYFCKHTEKEVTYDHPYYPDPFYITTCVKCGKKQSYDY